MEKIYNKNYNEITKAHRVYAIFLAILFLLFGIFRRNIGGGIICIVLIVATVSRVYAYINSEGFHKIVDYKINKSETFWKWEDVVAITYQYLSRKPDLILLYIQKNDDRAKKVYFSKYDFEKIKKIVLSANNNIKFLEAKSV